VKPNLRLERYFILAVEIGVVVKAIALQISQYSGRPNRIANPDTEILQRGTPCPIFKNTMQYLPSAIDGRAPYHPMLNLGIACAPVVPCRVNACAADYGR
jgi:hypothetical protein